MVENNIKIIERQQSMMLTYVLFTKILFVRMKFLVILHKQKALKLSTNNSKEMDF